MQKSPDYRSGYVDAMAELKATFDDAFNRLAEEAKQRHADDKLSAGVATDQATAILAMIRKLPATKRNKGKAFFDSIERQTREVVAKIEATGDVTPKQANALQKWHEGVEKWNH